MISPVNIATAVATALVALALAAPALSQDAPDVPFPTDTDGPTIPAEDAGPPPWTPDPDVTPGTSDVLPPGGAPAGTFSVEPREPSAAVLGLPDAPVRVVAAVPPLAVRAKARPVTRAARCAKLRRVGAGPKWIRLARCPAHRTRS